MQLHGGPIQSHLTGKIAEYMQKNKKTKTFYVFGKFFFSTQGGIKKCKEG